MPDDFLYDVFLSHSAKDKAVVRLRPVAASRQSAAFSSARLTWEKKMAALCRAANISKLATWIDSAYSNSPTRE